MFCTALIEPCDYYIDWSHLGDYEFFLVTRRYDHIIMNDHPVINNSVI